MEVMEVMRDEQREGALWGGFQSNGTYLVR